MTRYCINTKCTQGENCKLWVGRLRSMWDITEYFEGRYIYADLCSNCHTGWEYWECDDYVEVDNPVDIESPICKNKTPCDYFEE